MKDILSMKSHIHLNLSLFHFLLYKMHHKTQYSTIKIFSMKVFQLIYYFLLTPKIFMIIFFPFQPILNQVLSKSLKVHFFFIRFPKTILIYAVQEPNFFSSSLICHPSKIFLRFSAIIQLFYLSLFFPPFSSYSSKFIFVSFVQYFHFGINPGFYLDYFK